MKAWELRLQVIIFSRYLPWNSTNGPMCLEINQESETREAQTLTMLHTKDQHTNSFVRRLYIHDKRVWLPPSPSPLELQQQQTNSTRNYTKVPLGNKSDVTSGARKWPYFKENKRDQRSNYLVRIFGRVDKWNHMMHKDYRRSKKTLGLIELSVIIRKPTLCLSSCKHGLTSLE